MQRKEEILGRALVKRLDVEPACFAVGFVAIRRSDNIFDIVVPFSGGDGLRLYTKSTNDLNMGIVAARSGGAEGAEGGGESGNELAGCVEHFRGFKGKFL